MPGEPTPPPAPRRPGLRGRLRRLGGEALDELRREESIAALLVTTILVTRHALGTEAGQEALLGLWTALSRGVSGLFHHGVFRRQLVAITLQLVLPLLFVGLVHRRPLARYGLGAGDVRFWLPLTAAVFVVQVLVVALVLAQSPTYTGRYPTLSVARAGGTAFWVWESSRVVYMIGWEFLFRGYLMFALMRRMGLHATVVQTIPFVLMHIASRKPVSEIYFTVLSGTASGLFVAECRSIWPVVWLHAAGAVLLDILIVYG